MSKVDSVSETRAIRDCDAVEVAVGSLRYLRDLAAYALNEAETANTNLTRMSAVSPALVDETVKIRAAILSACDYVATVRDALDSLVPEEES